MVRFKRDQADDQEHKYGHGFKETRGYFKITLISIGFTIALAVMIIMLLLTQVFGKLILEAVIKHIGIHKEVPSL